MKLLKTFIKHDFIHTYVSRWHVCFLMAACNLCIFNLGCRSNAARAVFCGILSASDTSFLLIRLAVLANDDFIYFLFFEIPRSNYYIINDVIKQDIEQFTGRYLIWSSPLVRQEHVNSILLLFQ